MTKTKKNSTKAGKLPVKEIFIGASRESRKKARSSQNALRHGLTTVSRRHPAYNAAIVELAKLMCGDDDDPELFEKAAAVAESDILVREIRQYRNRLLKRLADPQAYGTTQARNERKRRLLQMDKSMQMGRQLLDIHPPRSSPGNQSKFDDLMKEYWTVEKDRDPDDIWYMALTDLDRINRYERRAWSRRKRVFLQYMVYRARCETQRIPVSIKHN
jgi:hypothetical protein